MATLPSLKVTCSAQAWIIYWRIGSFSLAAWRCVSVDYLCFIVPPLNKQSVLNILENARLICFISLATHFCCFLFSLEGLGLVKVFLYIYIYTSYAHQGFIYSSKLWWQSSIFSSHYFSLQCHMTLSKIILICLKNISYCEILNLYIYIYIYYWLWTFKQKCKCLVC